MAIALVLKMEYVFQTVWGRNGDSQQLEPEAYHRAQKGLAVSRRAKHNLLM
jgi:hypothetical protein